MISKKRISENILEEECTRENKFKVPKRRGCFGKARKLNKCARVRGKSYGQNKRDRQELNNISVYRTFHSLQVKWESIGPFGVRE